MIIRYLQHQIKVSSSPPQLTSMLIVMWMWTLPDYMAEKLKILLQADILEQDTSCSSVPAHHLEKPTSNRNCTQHLSCRICCSHLSHQETHHNPASPPKLVHCLNLTYIIPVIHDEVFEDNNSTCLLATNHCLSE